MGKSSSYYIDVATRHQVYLERIKAGQFKSFEPVLRKMDRGITQILRGLSVGSLGELEKKKFEALLREMRTLEIELLQGQTNKYLSQMETFSGNEVNFETKALAAAAPNLREVKKAAKAWSAARNKPIQATGQLLEPFLDGMSSRSVARIEGVMRTSLAQNRTVDQTIRAIRGTKAANYADGVINTNYRDISTVVRTATQHVSQTAREAVWVANKNIMDGYQWISTLDGVTSSTCQGLDKEVFEIGKGPQPPIHPNCRSTTVPYFKDFVELEKGGTRSSETGPVSAKKSYYTWLKGQPAKFQDDAMGPTWAKLMRNGGLTAEEFRELRLDKNFQPLTLAEARRLNPHAFEKANI